MLLLGPPLVLCGLGQSQRVLPHSLVEEKRVRMGYVVDSDAIWETQMNGWGGGSKVSGRLGGEMGKKSKKHRLPLKMNVSVFLCFAAKL